MKPIYSNDRKAPRMKKATFSTKVITPKMWTEFKNQFPEYKKMNCTELNARWNEIASIIREEIVQNPLGVKLGSYTGEIKFQYLPYKFEAVDPATSTELGEKVNHLNVVSRSKVGVIKWERRWAVKFNRMLQFFAFSPTRLINSLAEKHARKYPELLRVSRNTLGGKNYWRERMEKYGKGNFRANS